VSVTNLTVQAILPMVTLIQHEPSDVYQRLLSVEVNNNFWQQSRGKFVAASYEFTVQTLTQLLQHSLQTRY
jgi:hypothetical protein